MTITAKIIADSVSTDAIRLTTLQLRYPKFVHGEFMTHRVFSRNASSSRAIPVERLIKDVLEDPVYPSFWGKNQAGMQANQETDFLVDTYGWGGGTGWRRNDAWDLARRNAVNAARAFAAAGYHKQIVNRLLEPFCHINVVVTATEWSNFFALRCHLDAQPEMRKLAEAILDAMAGSVPVVREPGSWHLPYVTNDDWTEMLTRAGVVHDIAVDLGIRVSVARCARVSYLTQEGAAPSIDEDLKLHERLVGAVPLHASPAEHQATPDKNSAWTPRLHGNFRGWLQYRKTLPGESQ